MEAQISVCTGVVLTERSFSARFYFPLGKYLRLAYDGRTSACITSFLYLLLVHIPLQHPANQLGQITALLKCDIMLSQPFNLKWISVSDKGVCRFFKQFHHAGGERCVRHS